MNLPQENFERALESAMDTIATLDADTAPTLSDQPTQRLQGWSWDLEAIGAAIRLELMNREDVNPIDLGSGG